MGDRDHVGQGVYREGTVAAPVGPAERPPAPGDFWFGLRVFLWSGLALLMLGSLRMTWERLLETPRV